MRIVSVSFTKAGTEISKKLNKALKDKGYRVEAFGKYPSGIVGKLEGSIYEFTRTCFQEEVQGIIFVGALGIAVRAIAANIVSKGKDPAVVVMDDGGRFVIPVLSGHIGGANELATYISERLEAMPVITTATDGHGIFAIDTWAVKNQCSILELSKIKYISSALLKGEKVGFMSDYTVEGVFPEGIEGGINCNTGICISANMSKRPFEETLNLIPKEYIIGVGCRKNIPSEAFEKVLNNVLKEHNISVMQIKKIASIDIKASEVAILNYCKKNGLEFITYSAEELLKVEGEFSSSAFVKSITGVDNVCERAAQKASEDLEGKLVLKKKSCDGITVAISKINWRCRF